MLKSKKLLHAFTTFNVVRVDFNDGNHKTYQYKTLEVVEPGSYVVVMSPRGIPTIAQVVEFDDYNSIDPTSEDTIEFKWIVTVIDTTSYDHMVEEEKILEAKIQKTLEENQAREARKCLSNEMATALGKVEALKVMSSIKNFSKAILSKHDDSN